MTSGPHSALISKHSYCVLTLQLARHALNVNSTILNQRINPADERSRYLLTMTVDKVFHALPTTDAQTRIAQMIPYSGSNHRINMARLINYLYQ